MAGFRRKVDPLGVYGGCREEGEEGGDGQEDVGGEAHCCSLFCLISVKMSIGGVSVRVLSCLY